MSNVYNNDPEYGSVESTENPQAVWIRDIPSWMTKERFYNGISDWSGVIKEQSHFFKNKQNVAWNGWAKVTFTSTRARNNFIENPDQHFIQFAEDQPWERLKVTPWFDKNKTNKTPLYKNFEKEKSILKSEVNGDEIRLDEFDKNLSNNWSSSYKGVIGHYFTDKAGNGHVGYIEIKLLASNVTRTELIIFHSDSIWMCFKHDGCHGKSDCAIRCGVDNFLPKRLPIGSAVQFTARKIPRGVAGNKCYQANTIWIGSANLPEFVKQTSLKKLDEYLEDFKNEAGLVGGSPSKELTPENLKDSLASSRSNSGSNSPTPAFGQISRQKPLSGGLKQLGGKPVAKTYTQASKKQPANFAQAVARPTLAKAIVDEQSNLILAVGIIESLISENEALLVVPEYGKFNLKLGQIDLGFTPTYSIGNYVNPKTDTVSVTLKSNKLSGGKVKYDIIRAHVNKTNAEPQIDPFSNDQVVTNGTGSGFDSWEDLADDDFDKSEDTKAAKNTVVMDNSDNDINAGAELDDYFDNLQDIMDWLERELPKVLPTLANETDVFQQLSDTILGSEDESYILRDFLVAKCVSQRIVTIFVDEFSKFRNLNNEIEDSSSSSENVELSQSSSQNVAGSQFSSQNVESSQSSQYVAGSQSSQNVEVSQIYNGDIITLSSSPDIETNHNANENTIRFKSDADQRQRTPEKTRPETTLDNLDYEFRNKINLEGKKGYTESDKENLNKSKELELTLERFMLDYFLKQRGKNPKEFSNIEKEKTMSHVMATSWATIKPLDKIRDIFEKKEKPEIEQFYEELYNILSKGLINMLSKEMSPSDMDLELCSGLTALYFMDGWYKNNRRDRSSGEISEDEPTDMDTQELVLSFLNWVKQVVRNKEMSTEKIELYADALQNQRNVIRVWAKVMGSKEEHFIPFMNKKYLDQKSLINLRIWLLSKRHNYKKFIDMFEADTNTFRMESANEKAKSKVLDIKQKRVNLGLDLETSQLEEEFMVHQDKAQETRAFILRAIAFMKKCGVSLDELAEMHNIHLREMRNRDFRNKEFKMKIESFLHQKSNQKFLDETNMMMQKQSKSKEHTPYSSTRVDKYIPVLAQALCGFFVDRLNTKDDSKSVRGVSETSPMPKSPAKMTTNGDHLPSHNGDASSSNGITIGIATDKNGGRKRRLSQTDGEKEKKALPIAKSSSTSEVTKSNVFLTEDYVNFRNFLEISVESKAIDLPSNVSLDGILCAFQARDIPFNKLESIYEKTNVGDSSMWRLQISQLRLNPPVGVTVPQLADMLHSYFETVGNKFKEISTPTPELKSVEESCLLSLMQRNLFDQFHNEDLRRVSNTLSKVPFDRVGGFGDMMAKLHQVYKSHQLYNGTDGKTSNRWSCCTSLWIDLSKFWALLTSRVWSQQKVTFEYLRSGVKDLKDNNTSSKELMTSWARVLENSDIFPGSMLDIATIIKATMAYFTRSKFYPDNLGTEIVTETGLYNIRGIVTQHISQHFAIAQTPYGLVLCQTGTIFKECSKTGKAMVPVQHWGMCQLEECLPVGTRVLLHGIRLREPPEGIFIVNESGPVVCQVATLVWRSGRRPRDPPESGPILPGSKQYFDLVCVHAKKYARMNSKSFSNVDEGGNLLKYNLALEAANQEMVGISAIYEKKSEKEINSAIYEKKNKNEADAFASEIDRHGKSQFGSKVSSKKHERINGYAVVDEEEAEEVRTIWEEADFDIKFIRQKFVFYKVGGMTIEQLREKYGQFLSSVYNYPEEDKFIVITRTLAYLENDSLNRDIISNGIILKKKNPSLGPPDIMALLDEAFPESLQRYPESLQRYPESLQRYSPDPDEMSDEDIQLEVSENEEEEKEHDTIHDESMQQAQRHLEQIIMDNDHEDQNTVGKKHKSLATKDVKRKEVTKPELPISREIVVASKETRSPDRDSKEKEADSITVSKNPDTSKNQDSSNQRPPIDQATLEAMAVKIEDLHYWQIYTKQYIESNAEFQLNQDVSVKSISTRLTAVEEAIKSLSETLKSAPTELRTSTETIKKSRTYVKIIKSGDSNDVDEVPTNSQGLLPQSTVKALYEGTSAIKWKTPSNTWRSLLLEEDLYHPPEDGWRDRIYHCTIPQGLVWKTDASQTKNGPPLSRAPGSASTLDASAYTADTRASPYPPTSMSMPPSSLPMFSSTTNSLPVINVNPAFLTGLPGIPLLGRPLPSSRGWVERSHPF